MSLVNFEGTKNFLYEVQKNKNNICGINNPLIDSRKNILDLKILVGVDVSGSITSSQYQRSMQQLDLIRGLSVVKVIEIDSEIVAMYDYFKVKNRIIRLKGGGGTEFSPFFNLAKKFNCDAILFFTDGEVFGQTIPDCGIPTGWIITKDGKQPYSWGKIVHQFPDV
jgi:predicted metal-dependent peptidase